MSDEIRSLSETEIDAVAGGLQHENQPQGLVVMPDPGFVIGTAPPGPTEKTWSWGIEVDG